MSRTEPTQTPEIVKKAPTEEVFETCDIDYNFLNLVRIKANEVTGGQDASIQYENPLDTQFATRPIVRFIEEVMIAGPGMEPKEGKFTKNKEGGWDVRKELPLWDADTPKGWTVQLVADKGGELHDEAKRITQKLGKIMAEKTGISSKKVRCVDALNIFGEFSSKGSVTVKINRGGVIYDNSKNALTVGVMGDYPLETRDTLSSYCLQPTFPWLRADKDNKGMYLFSVNWTLRSAVVGPKKALPVEKTQEEKDEYNKSLFAPPGETFCMTPSENKAAYKKGTDASEKEEDSKKRPLETESEDLPQQKKQK